MTSSLEKELYWLGDQLWVLIIFYAWVQLRGKSLLEADGLLHNDLLFDCLVVVNSINIEPRDYSDLADGDALLWFLRIWWQEEAIFCNAEYIATYLAIALIESIFLLVAVSLSMIWRLHLNLATSVWRVEELFIHSLGLVT